MATKNVVNKFVKNWVEYYVWNQITVDSAMSSTSTNPVQNRIIYAALQLLLKSSDWSITDIRAMSEDDYQDLVNGWDTVATCLYVTYDEDEE